MVAMRPTIYRGVAGLGADETYRKERGVTKRVRRPEPGPT
nr:hypothetical protein RTCK_00678 [Rhizobium sp. TCK]